MKRRVLGGVLAGLIVFCIASPLVFATADPDSYDITEAYAYRNLLETDDRLIIFAYDIEYATTPNETARQTFIFQFMSADNTTEYGQVTPYPYHTKGYGKGISGFYFSAADNLTWSENYTIRISGNPAFLPGLAPKTFALTEADWYSSNTSDLNKAALAGRIVDMVGTLEQSWSVNLLEANTSGYTVLNSTGQTYVLLAIPVVNYMAPAAFQVQLYDMTYTPRTWATTQADAYKNRFVGTWVQDAADAAAEITTFNFQLAMSIPFLICAVALMAAYRVKFESSTPAILDVLALRYLWVLLGWISLGISALITFLLAAVLGYIILFDRG